jgi:MFS family permease
LGKGSAKSTKAGQQGATTMSTAIMGGATRTAPMTREEKKVIFASSLGTVFEWYDFYLYGSLAAIIGAQFFSQYPEATRNVFALLAFAAGFLVRPFGALVFGRLGDLVGRKHTFLITIVIMGLSTFVVGLLPSYNWFNQYGVGWLAPTILIGLRMLQGLALGGEYGGAAIYVAEHAPNNRRGFYTGWIQTTATLGLLLSLVVIMFVQIYVNAHYTGGVGADGQPLLGSDGKPLTAFQSWGWRIPFLVSVVLLGISVWIRLQMQESPAFKKMKQEGTNSKAPLSEAFLQPKNAWIALTALLGLVAGQAVVWYTGQFYALFFMQNILKVDQFTANVLIAWSLILGTGGFLFFGALSDRIGRKPIILGGCVIAAALYFPLFNWLTATANPDLHKAQSSTVVKIMADPADCSFQFNPTNTLKFNNSCDIAKAALAKAGVNYSVEPVAAGTSAKILVGTTEIPSYDVVKNAAAAKESITKIVEDLKVKAAAPTATPEDKTNLEQATAAFDKGVTEATNVAVGGFNKALADALKTAGYPGADNASIVKINIDPKAGLANFAGLFDIFSLQKLTIILILTIMVVLVTMVYGPIAAALVELFPTRIRYSGMSLPYHIGNGWFGGLMPATAFAIVAQTGNIYAGLWYPIIVALGTAVIGLLLVPETHKRDIFSEKS